MPTLSFPSNPSLNDTYTFGGKTWVYNGSAWDLQTQGAINGIVIGNVTPATGAFTTLTSTGNTTLGDVAGDLVPAANLTYSLGNATNQWANIYVGGNTIFLGGLQLKDDGGNTLGVYAADGTTPADILAEVDAANIVGTVANATYSIQASISDTANAVAGANVTGTVGLAQYVTQAAQGNITSVGTLTSLAVTGNVDAGNFISNGLITASGQITGSQFNGSGAGLSSIPGANVTGTVANATYATSSGSASTATSATSANTVTDNAQPNITSVGTLTSLTATGNITGGNIITAGTVTSGSQSITGNVDITGNVNVTGNLNYENVTDLVVGDPLIYIGEGNPGNAYDLGMVVSWDDGTYQHGGWVRDASDGGTWKLFGNVIPEPTTTVDFSNAIYQPMRAGAITADAGSLSSLLVSGNIITGNILTDGYYYANGVPFSGGGGGGISWTTQANTAPSSPNPGDFWYDSFADVKYQYINDGIANVWVDQSFPTSFSSISVGNVTNSNANGIGNIGSAASYFNTVFAKSTSAQYADLAELYVADADYPPGTVVIFGGEKEITSSTQSHDSRVAGVISTDPSYLMNAALNDQYSLPVALVGRVPCRVQGPVSRGDILVTGSVPGTAQKLQKQWQPGCVIGKSLQDIEDDTIQTIEIAIGRF